MEMIEIKPRMRFPDPRNLVQVPLALLMICSALVVSARVVENYRQAWTGGTGLMAPTIMLVRWMMFLSSTWGVFLLGLWLLHRSTYKVTPIGVVWAFSAGWHWFMASIALVAWQAGGSAAIVVGLFGFSMVAAGANRFRKALQCLVRDVDDVLTLNLNPPVLYLRSFVSDDIVHPEFENPERQLQRGVFKLLRPTFWIYQRELTFEEVLCQGIGALGPVVAIGRPGEELPQLGAFRKYVPDDRWRDEVHHLVDTSTLVAMLVGHTRGLVWELGELSRKCDGSRVLLIIPPTADPQSLWEGFHRLIEDSGRAVPLPVTLNENAVAIGFRPGWIPVMFAGKRSASVYREIGEWAMRRSSAH